MSHYEIQFGWIEDPKVREREALIAAIQYFGKISLAKKWLRVARDCKTERLWYFYSSFAGIQGYPAEAAWKKYHN